MQTTTTNKACLEFSNAIMAFNGKAIPMSKQIALLDKFFPSTASPNWKIYSRKFFQWYDRFVTKSLTCNDNGKIFAKDGNRKLPFLSFSTLPSVTCPGAGECLDFCYSFKAWRNVHPFFRQLRNTVMMAYGFEVIEAELDKVLKSKHFKSLDKVDFRLYVDGDFSSVADIANWMRVFRKHSRLAGYGYSKSWDELIEYGNTESFPSNYVLNLSSGSKYGMEGEKFDAMSKLTCTRNAFVAVKIANGLQIDTPEYRKEVKAVANKGGITKLFICGGACGDCTKNGHACGLASLNAPVVIGIH
jgi:hypothetical protein